MTPVQYPRVSAEEAALIEKHGHLLVNTGGPSWPDSREHVLDLLNDFRRPDNRDLSVNIVRYLLGYGIECQLGLLVRQRQQ